MEKSLKVDLEKDFIFMCIESEKGYCFQLKNTKIFWIGITIIREEKKKYRTDCLHNPAVLNFSSSPVLTFVVVNYQIQFAEDLSIKH